MYLIIVPEIFHPSLKGHVLCLHMLLFDLIVNALVIFGLPTFFKHDEFSFQSTCFCKRSILKYSLIIIDLKKKTVNETETENE